MRLVVNIMSNNVGLELVDQGKTIDSLDWEESNSMSRLLLVKIDKLLHRSEAGLDKISDYKIISEVPRKYTSYRIVEITLKSLMIARGLSH
jgi:hypothetical protein